MTRQRKYIKNPWPRKCPVPTGPRLKHRKLLPPVDAHHPVDHGYVNLQPAAASTADVFRGEIIIHENNGCSDAAFDSANEATAPQLTPGQKLVPIFVHSSHISGTDYGDDPGGYAAVFDRIHASVDQPSHVGKQVEMAWHIKPVFHYNLAHGMSIAQAIRSITDELRAWKDAALASAGSDKDAIFNRLIVQIFSPSKPMLLELQNVADRAHKQQQQGNGGTSSTSSPSPSFVLDRDKSLKNKVLGAIIDESIKFKQVGLDVGLELHWCRSKWSVPGRVPPAFTRAVELADFARKRHKNWYRVGDKGPRKELDLSNSVFEEYRQDFVWAHWRHQLYLHRQKRLRQKAKDKKRSEKAKASELADEEKSQEKETERW